MKVGVIGSGSIGPDLAYGFATSLAKGEGGSVHLLDIKQEALDAGVHRIQGYVSKGLARGRRIRWSRRLSTSWTLSPERSTREHSWRASHRRSSTRGLASRHTCRPEYRAVYSRRCFHRS